MSDALHLALGVPGFLGAWVLAVTLGGRGLTRGAGGLANVIVIEKSLADSDAVDDRGVRVLVGETRRDRPFVTSLAVRLDESGKLPAAFASSPAGPLVTAPLFRFMRRRAPGRVRTTYRIWS
jgi:hypothetical protein